MFKVVFKENLDVDSDSVIKLGYQNFENTFVQASSTPFLITMNGADSHENKRYQAGKILTRLYVVDTRQGR